ncbi:hypothetical protein RTG_01239 [Rhodotorula toruloides ATCC 204091]|uniref:Uncharacterized protein n=1 Tax=Rhodotorula toruloides TaxID=5286 RepID=A0A2T0AIQ2_RHOTO|nr:hypothetical protein RTG_01239 [Rhodotorula toruloides ATCC 204091]PRQ77872.1 hypothetical protein AAT19DRAFT_8940 [Rhodotorula toruloides]
MAPHPSPLSSSFTLLICPLAPRSSAMPNWNKVNVFKRKERHRQGESSRTERPEELSGPRRRSTEDEELLMGRATHSVHQSRVRGRRGEGEQILRQEEEERRLREEEERRRREEEEGRRRRRPSNESLVLGGEHGHSHETDVGVQTDSEAGHDDDRDLLAAVDDAADRAYGFGPGHREMPNYSVFPQGGHPQPKKAPSSKEEIEASLSLHTSPNMPWRPKIFKSREDRKKRDGESSASNRRPGTRGGEAGSHHDAEDVSRPGLTRQPTFDEHPGTRVWLPQEIEERNHPGRRLTIPERSSAASFADQTPSQQHLNQFTGFDEGDPDIGVQTSDEEGEPLRRSSSRSKPESPKSPRTRSRTDMPERRHSQSRRRDADDEANKPSLRSGRGALMFRDPFAQDKKGGQGESSRR